MNPGKPSLAEGIQNRKCVITALTLGQLPFLAAGALFHQRHKKLLGICSGLIGAIKKVFQ